jgi:hypothetical protein
MEDFGLDGVTSGGVSWFLLKSYFRLVVQILGVNTLDLS